MGPCAWHWIQVQWTPFGLPPSSINRLAWWQFPAQYEARGPIRSVFLGWFLSVSEVSGNEYEIFFTGLGAPRGNFRLAQSPQQGRQRSGKLKAGPPPLDLSFWSFLTFLHHGIEEVERHLLWKFYKKIRRKRWSNVPPKLVTCIGFLYKVVHKIGRLRKFNRSRGI